MRIRKNSILIVAAVIAAFSLCACGTSPDSGIIQRRRGTGKQNQTENLIQQEESSEIKEAAAESELYILRHIDMEQKTADFEKERNGRLSQYTYDTGTKFLDKYGDTKSISSFMAGEVVELQISDKEQKLKKVQLSSDVWVQEDIVNYSVDSDRHALIIGQTIYSYDPDRKIFSGDTTVGFSDLGEEDELRVIGKDKQILSVAVTKGHGYLTLANTKLFDGSFICVGEKIFQEVSSGLKIEVPEGTHLVTVANNGYGGSREVVIERDKTTSINLDELKGEGPKICKITFHVGVEGAVLLIDGKQADYSVPVELTYGIHTISVAAEGYDTISKKLVVNSKEAEIEIALTSSSESTSETASKPANNNNNNNANNNNNNNNNNNANTNNNNSNNNNTNSNNNNTNQNNASQDYLTTLYDLLTSMNKSNNNSNNNNADNNNQTSASGNNYDDLRDQ